MQITQPTAALPAPQTYTTYYDVIAEFFSEPGHDFANGAPFVSPGSCLVYSTSTKPSTSTAPSVTKPLNVGTPLLLTGGDPLSVSIPEIITTPVAYYSATFTTPALTAGTQYTLTAPGSSSISPFTVPITWQDLITWTNGPSTGSSAAAQGQLVPRSNNSSISTITESEGQLITWSGGVPDSWVIVSGTSNAPAVSLNVSFYCAALASDGQLTLPAYLLDTLPAGVGTLYVENETQPQSFTVTGIDYGYTVTGLVSSENVTYQLEASTTPPESSFNGTYTGTFSGKSATTGKSISGGVSAVIDNGVFTVTSPGSGTGTVSSTGQIAFGVDVSEGVSCNFNGQVVVTGAAAAASGTFTCANGSISGSWSVTRD